MEFNSIKKGCEAIQKRETWAKNPQTVFTYEAIKILFHKKQMATIF